MSTNILILACFIIGCATVFVVVCEICECIRDMHKTSCALKSIMEEKNGKGDQLEER